MADEIETNFKKKTRRSEKYRAWVVKQDCILSNKHQCTGDVVAMHTSGGGTGLKGDDYSCIPGCYACHQELPENKEAFRKKWGVDIEEKNLESLAAYLYEKYEKWFWESEPIMQDDLKWLLAYVEEVEG